MTTLTREGLYEEIWSSPMTAVSKKYGISDVGLRKIAVSLGIPVPPRGYWARVSNGQTLPRQPLRPWKGTTTHTLSKHHAATSTEGRGSGEPPGITAAKEFERATANRITVPNALQKPHPVVSATKKALKEHRPYRSLPVWCSGGDGVFTIEVTKPAIDRALMLADTFLEAAEKRGYELSWSSENKSAKRDILFLTVSKDGGRYRVRLRQKPGTLIVEPPDFPSARKTNIQPPATPAPILQLDLSDYIFGYGMRTFQDTPTKQLEMQLNNVFLWMATHPIREAIERAAREEAARQREIAHQERMRPFRVRDAELERLKNCEKEASEFARAESLRAYADAMEKSIRGKAPASKFDEAIYEPVRWMRARANWIDPLTRERWPAVDDLVGVREPSYWES